MPPRKPARRSPVRKRKPASRGKQPQLPVGLLFAIVLILLIGGFMFLRLSGQTAPIKDNVVKEEKVKKPVEKPKEKPKEIETIAPPPIKIVEEPKPRPEPEIKIVEKTIEVEKPVEIISVPNAVKLFMFDKRLNQDSITVKDFSISLETDSDKNAKKLSEELVNYLSDNKLTIISKKPIKVKDAHEAYTISFTIKTPPPAPKPEPVKQPVKQTVKPKEPEKKKTVVPAPVIKKQPAKPVNFTAKMALVIDDCGFSVPLANKLASLGYPVTFAVIPYTPYAKETAQIAKKSGNTLFIHFPMQPKSYPDFDPGKGAVFLNMPEALIASITRANMQSLGMDVDGANNHTGSAFTESEEKMTQALSSIKQFTPRFLDSYTSGSSRAYAVCRRLGMQCAVNSTFLDNEEPGLVTGSEKQNHVHTQLVSAAKKALSNGSTIAIGHLRGDTVAALPYSLAEIEKMGVKIVPVTELMN